MIDWNKKLEVVNGQGAVLPAVWVSRQTNGGITTVMVMAGFPGDIIEITFYGSDKSGGWTIRNVQPTTPQIPAELVERMVSLVRELAAVEKSTLTGFVGDRNWEKFRDDAARRHTEARAIVAELPVVEPKYKMDPDLPEAAKLLCSMVGPNFHMYSTEYAERGAYDDDPEIKIALKAIKRGRELAEKGR